MPAKSPEAIARKKAARNKRNREYLAKLKETYDPGLRIRIPPSAALKDMRHVSSEGKEKDLPRHEFYRKLYLEKPAEFLAKLTALETELGKREDQRRREVGKLKEIQAKKASAISSMPAGDSGASRPDAPESFDEGTARALELWKRLLLEQKGGG